MNVDNDVESDVCPFSMLAGMADHLTIVAGGISSSAPCTALGSGRCDSLLNQVMQKRFDNNLIVQRVKEECKDDSWRLHLDDIVYMDSCQFPMRVFRIDFGDYQRQVRFSEFSENTNDWSTGMWVNTDRLYKLELNDSLEAIRDFADATENQRRIKGTVCTFRGWDDDGDALLRMGSVAVVIFREDFNTNMTLLLSFFF